MKCFDYKSLPLTDETTTEQSPKLNANIIIIDWIPQVIIILFAVCIAVVAFCFTCLIRKRKNQFEKPDIPNSEQYKNFINRDSNVQLFDKKCSLNLP